MGEREQEGVSFKLEIASSVAMMGRKLGAKQNAKERSLERGRDDERRGDERVRKKVKQGEVEGCMNERTYRFFIYSLVYLAKMQSEQIADLALAVIRKTMSRYCDTVSLPESRKFITRSNDETSSVVGSNEVLTSV